MRPHKLNLKQKTKTNITNWKRSEKNNERIRHLFKPALKKKIHDNESSPAKTFPPDPTARFDGACPTRAVLFTAKRLMDTAVNCPNIKRNYEAWPSKGWYCKFSAAVIYSWRQLRVHFPGDRKLDWAACPNLPAGRGLARGARRPAWIFERTAPHLGTCSVKQTDLDSLGFIPFSLKPLPVQGSELFIQRH